MNFSCISIVALCFCVLFNWCINWLWIPTMWCLVISEELWHFMNCSSFDLNFFIHGSGYLLAKFKICAFHYTLWTRHVSQVVFVVSQAWYYSVSLWWCCSLRRHVCDTWWDVWQNFQGEWRICRRRISTCSRILSMKSSICIRKVFTEFRLFEFVVSLLFYSLLSTMLWVMIYSCFLSKPLCIVVYSELCCCVYISDASLYAWSRKPCLLGALFRLCDL